MYICNIEMYFITNQNTFQTILSNNTNDLEKLKYYFSTSRNNG